MSRCLRANVINKISTKKSAVEITIIKAKDFEEDFLFGFKDTLYEFKHSANCFCGMISMEANVLKGFIGLFKVPSELTRVELISSSFRCLKGRCRHVGQSDSPHRW